ncbi:MAG: hypothetical protein GX914_07255 [Erysipelotrichia bacterium]|nr:hypothetical protein [Erysipelotrichia bacterium]
MIQEKNKEIVDFKTKNYLRFFSIVYLVLIIVVATLFFTDLTRMRHNQPVVFSTWGFSYSPPIDIKEEIIEMSIVDFLMVKGDKEYKHHGTDKAFASIRIYLIEEKDDGLFYAYAWVLQEKYYLENNEIIMESGSSQPYRVVLEKVNDEFVIVDIRTPRIDCYESDMKDLFPRTVRKNMEKVHNDGTIEKLNLDIQKQLKLYFH